MQRIYDANGAIQVMDPMSFNIGTWDDPLGFKDPFDPFYGMPIGNDPYYQFSIKADNSQSQ